MGLSEPLIDLLRASHLLCFAAGLGTSLYFDQRSLRKINQPVTKAEVDELHAFHKWITAAFIGLWVTGFLLIFVRTGFVLEQFTPKLWAKLAIVTLMVANAVAVAKIVLPVMEARIGRQMISLPADKLALISQIAINSVYCWTAGLALGSSHVLKTATWEVLLPLLIGAFVVFTVVGQLLIWLIRLRALATLAQESSVLERGLSLFELVPATRKSLRGLER